MQVTQTTDQFVSILNLSPWLLIVIVGIPLGALVFGVIHLTRRRLRDPESADFGKEALAIIAGGFVFVGAFSVVTSWDIESSLKRAVTSEFSAVTSLAEDMGDIKNPAGKALVVDLVAYAETVRADEIGTSGIVASSPEAQKMLASIQDSVVSLTDSLPITEYQKTSVFTHLDALKDARKARLAVSIPNLPPFLAALIIISAALALAGVSLYPPSRLVWIKHFYVGASLIVVTGLIVSIMVLQSPNYAASQVTHTIDLFTTSFEQGGANLDSEQPAMGDAPVPGNGENPGPPDGGPKP